MAPMDHDSRLLKQVFEEWAIEAYVLPPRLTVSSSDSDPGQKKKEEKEKNPKKKRGKKRK